MRTAGILAMAVIAGTFLVACGEEDNGAPSPSSDNEQPTPTSGPAGDVSRGEAIFTGEANVVTPACTTCHTIGDGDLVGPDLQGVATRAEARLTDVGVEAYLRESIVDPQGYIVPGFPEGGMPDVFEEQLSEEDLDALVAYLLTLEQP